MNRAKRLFFLFVFFAVFVLAILFARDNSQAITLNLLGSAVLSLPFALWLVVSFVLGAVLTLLLLTPMLGIKEAQLRRLKRGR